MTARMVNAIPTANTNLVGFGAICSPHGSGALVPVPVLVPVCRTFRGANRERCVSYFTFRIIIILMETIKHLYQTPTAIRPRSMQPTRLWLDDMDLLPTVIVGTWCLADDISDALRYRRCEAPIHIIVGPTGLEANETSCQLVKLGQQGRTWLASFQCRGAGLEKTGSIVNAPLLLWSACATSRLSP